MASALSSATSTLLIGSTSLANASSSRHRPPSLAPQRVEGWTEVWGGRDDPSCKSGSTCNAAGDHHHRMELPYLPPRYIHVMNDGCDYIHGRTINKISTEKSSSSSSVPRQDPSSMPPLLQLTQFRVAWFEQLVLRMNFIPHVVVNSGYAAAESTGALPCLLDLSNNENNTMEFRNNGNLPNKPALIGRDQPGGLGSYFFHQCHENSASSPTATATTSDTTTTTSNNHKRSSCFIHSGSHIVDYLRRKYNNMGKHIIFPEQLVSVSLEEKKENQQLYIDILAYDSMIQDKLNYILLALRYGNDPAWEGVYKHQCIRATLDPNGDNMLYANKDGSAAVGVVSKKRAFFALWARYQAYSERVLALHNLLPSTHSMSLSTHGGLGLELFRYNDYRCSTSTKGSYDANVETDEESTPGSTVHQHHPYSSFIVGYGGVGGGDSGRVNVYRAMELADSYYAVLEDRLLASSPQSCCDVGRNDIDKSKRVTYLLGSDKPTYVDALLFAHLAEALCDIHLVLVLAKHSRLTRYFQRMYDHFFGDEYLSAWENNSSQYGSTESANWIQKNNIVNALNAFNQIPEPTTTSISKQTSNESGHQNSNNMVHAIQLMQQIAVHCHELDEALRDAAALRNAEGREKSVLESCHRPVGARLYRWLMGADVTFWGSGGTTQATTISDGGMTEDDTDDEEDGPQSGNTNDPPSSEEEDKRRRYQDHLNRVKRDRRSHDELWLVGVGVTVVAAFVASAAGKSKR